jgi:hypothetical protein
MPIFPRNNLPTDSLNWGREVERSVNNLESGFRTAEVNNVSRDAQLQSNVRRLDTTVTQLAITTAAADAANAAAIQALEEADAAQTTATSANATAISANATAISANSTAIEANTKAIEALEEAGAAQDEAIEANNKAIEALELAQGFQLQIDAAQDEATAANNKAIEALEDADAAQADAIAALQGLGSLDEATSTYKINASNLTVGTLNASVVNVTNLNASNITSGSLSADRISGGVISGVGNITSMETIFAAVNLGAGVNIAANGSLFLGGDANIDGRILGSIGTFNATTTSTANLFVASNGNFARSTSSRRYKADIQDMDYGMKALELQPRTWVDIVEYEENGNSAEGLNRIPGFIAEELHDLGLNELVQYNEDGQPDAVYYDRMLVAILPVIKNQQELIENLTTRLAALEDRVQ